MPLRFLDTGTGGRRSPVWHFPDLVLSGFLRIVTHPRVFSVPTPIDEALGFHGEASREPHVCSDSSRPTALEHLHRALPNHRSRGNLVPDAYLAALAIESGSEWITTDRDYSRFPACGGGHRCLIVAVQH